MNELLHVGVTGTNGKTSTTRFVAAGRGALGRPVVSVTTVGAFLDEEQLSTPMNRSGMLEAIALGRERGGRYAAL